MSTIEVIKGLISIVGLGIIIAIGFYSCLFIMAMSITTIINAIKFKKLKDKIDISSEDIKEED